MESTLVDIVSLLKQYGPLLVVLFVVLWQSWQREARMDKRLARLEDEQRKTLVTLVERCADVIAQNTLTMERLDGRLERM